MIHKALRRARTRYGIFATAALLFIAGVMGAVGVTGAYYRVGFDAKTATFAGGYVAVPTIGAVYPSTSVSTIGGYDGVLVWTNGVDETTTNNEIQQILGADQGSTSNCTGASYSTTVTNSITSPTTLSTFTYTDSNRATTPSNINGDWYCYEVVHGWPNTTAPVWTAAATTNVQIGLAPISVVINGGNTGDGTIDKSDTTAGPLFHHPDTIVITYNQPVVDSGAGTNKTVCSFTTGGAILIGDTTACNGGSTIADANTTGKISETIGGGTKKGVGTIAVSGNQITITITTNGGTASGSPTFVASTNGGTVLSAATTDQATACTSGVNCTISVSGNF
jgi:hypothetical protein